MISKLTQPTNSLLICHENELTFRFLTSFICPSNHQKGWFQHKIVRGPGFLPLYNQTSLPALQLPWGRQIQIFGWLYQTEITSNKQCWWQPKKEKVVKEGSTKVKERECGVIIYFYHLEYISSKLFWCNKLLRKCKDGFQKF